MEIVQFKNADKYEPEKDWIRSSLCNQTDISIEHFVKPPKHSSPTHSHPNTQVLHVLHGEIIVRNDIAEHILKKGDTLYIQGGEEHTVINSLDEISIGLDIFIPGRSFDFWLKRIDQQ